MLAELRRRGYAVVEEPGRRIVAEELAGDGAALPWIDPAAFARRAIALALADHAAAPSEGWVFFDRGLIDAAVALEHLTGEPAVETLCRLHRYHRRVFVAPPWPEIPSIMSGGTAWTRLSPSMNAFRSRIPRSAMTFLSCPRRASPTAPISCWGP